MRGRLLGLKHRAGRVVNGRNRRLEKTVSPPQWLAASEP